MAVIGGGVSEPVVLLTKTFLKNYLRFQSVSTMLQEWGIETSDFCLAIEKKSKKFSILPFSQFFAWFFASKLE